MEIKSLYKEYHFVSYRYLLIFLFAILFLTLLLYMDGSVGHLQSTTTEAKIPAQIISYPSNVKVEDPIKIRWWVIPPKGAKMTHTGIHYGYFSHPGGLIINSDSNVAGYTDIAVPIHVYQSTDFEVNIIPLKKGTMYFRVHVVIDDQNYWSDERTIIVK
jgi:hypothetical protein